jgi:hypothetical protein
VYLPAPVVFSAASIMAVGLPMMEKLLLTIVIPSAAREPAFFDRSMSLGD